MIFLAISWSKEFALLKCYGTRNFVTSYSFWHYVTAYGCQISICAVHLIVQTKPRIKSNIIMSFPGIIKKAARRAIESKCELIYKYSKNLKLAYLPTFFYLNLSANWWQRFRSYCVLYQFNAVCKPCFHHCTILPES